MKATLRRITSDSTGNTAVVPTPSPSADPVAAAKPITAVEVAPHIIEHGDAAEEVEEDLSAQNEAAEAALTTTDGFADELLAAAEDIGDLAPADAAAEPTTALAVAQPRTVAQPSGPDYTSASGGSLEGDFDANDLRLPRLLVVNGNGKLSQQYNQGTVILADEVLSQPPTDAKARYCPIRIIPVHIKKQWRMNLTKEESDAGLMPTTVDTKEEAEAIGGATAWINNEKPRWAPSARCIFLVEQPKDKPDHPAFSIGLEDDKGNVSNFAACVFYASGGTFGATANQIFNTAQWGLRDPKDKRKILLWLKYWTMDFGKVQAGDFMVYRPAVKVTTALTDESVREVARMIAGVKEDQIEVDA